MKLSELKPEQYKIKEGLKEENNFYGANIPVIGKVIGGLSNVGIGIGTEVGKTGLGLSQLALKAASKVTGSEFLGEAAEQTKELSQKLYKKPFEKELKTTTGKAGQLTGIAATFMAPSSKIVSGQKILSALTKPLSGGSRLAQFGTKVVSRAIPEAISDFAVELTRTGGDVEKAKFAGITGGIASGVLTSIGSAARATFWPELKDSTTRALGVQGKTTGGRILPQVEKKVAGLGVIKKYSPIIKVKDDLGIEKSFNPKNASFHETLQAWNQARKQIYNSYSEISASLGDDVAVDISTIADDLSNIVNSPRTSTYKNAAQSILNDLVDNFGNVTKGEFDGTFRKIKPKDMETFLSDLYNEAGSTLAGRSDKAHGEIAAATASKIREFLDNVIESSSGSQYGQLKGEYSALKSIEQDLVRRFQQEARRMGGGLTDYVNLFSSGDVIAGIMTGQPALIAKGTAQTGFGAFLKHLKRPDRYLQRAFNLIDSKNVGDISARMFGTSDEALSSAERRIINNARDFIKSPKIGLGIEDVTKKKVDDISSISISKASGQYVYHGTNEDVLANISKEGLKPSRKGTLSLSTDEVYAKSFAREGITPQGKTSPVMLRVNKGLLEGKTVSSNKPRPASDQLNEILTKETIPPEAIEVFKDGKWQPLIKESNLTTSIKSAKQSGQSFDEWVKGAKTISQAETGKPITIKGFHGTPDGRFLEEFDPTKKGYFRDAPDLLPDNTQWNELYGKTGKDFEAGGKGVKSVGVYEGVSFSSDYRVAKSYSEKPAFDYQNSVPMVVERNIVLKNPKVIDVQKGEWKISLEETIKQAKKEGHDGLVFKNIKDNYHPKDTKFASDNIVVFDPKSIKTRSEWDGVK